MSEILYNWEWEDYEDYRTKYGTGSGNMEAFSMWMRTFQYFDGLGILIHKGLLDKALVAEMMSESLVLFWDKCKPIVEAAREYHNLPLAMRWTEYLYIEIKKHLEEYSEHKI